MPAPAEATSIEVVNLTLNGQEVQARPGQTILEVARETGVDIPTLCHDPRLEPYGACRLCLVEVEGARGPMAACGAKVSEGMKVQTHTDKIVKLRKFVLELLLTNHPLDCPVCEAAGDCRLQDYAYEYLVDMVPWGWRPPQVGEPGNHPNVAHFGARCILCGRCVRICREVMSIGCWGYLNRGYDSEVDTPYRLPLEEVGCVSCGQCVSTCPVGAVTGQRTQFGVRTWQTDKVRTVCSYCSNGCELLVHGYNGRLVQVQSEQGRGLNQGNLCVRGRFGQGYVNASDRLLQPLIRDSAGELQPATWGEALARIVDEAQAAREQGGEAFAALCGAHVTNEAAYLLQKLARTVMGSQNLDSADLYRRRAADEALERALGSSSATGTRKDLATADAILVIGSNITDSNPVLSLAIIKAARDGRTVIVIDPRSTDLARKATFHLAPKPGTDLFLVRGFLAHILALGLEDKAVVVSGAEGLDELRSSLRDVDIEAEARRAGVDPGLLRAAAEAYGRADAAAILFGSGVMEGPAAEAVATAIADLALLTGNVGRPGTGLYPLYYTANAQGLKDMGVVPREGGKALPEIIDGLDDGSVRFLYVVGEDPALALADEARTRASLAAAPFLVVQDSYLTDTASYAHVVLPAAVPTEVDGTYTNGECFVQRLRAVTPPAGQSRPDWQIISDIASRLGADWPSAAPADVMREIAEVYAAYSEVSYASLEDQELLAARAPGAAGAGPRFVPPATAVPSDDGSTAQRPFLLITGSVREHHGTGVRSRRSEGLTKLMPAAQLQMNPTDAQGLGLGEGDQVKVTAGSERSIELSVTLTARIPEGIVFVPAFSPEAPVTRLLDRRSSGVTRVGVERVAG